MYANLGSAVFGVVFKKALLCFDSVGEVGGYDEENLGLINEPVEKREEGEGADVTETGRIEIWVSGFPPALRRRKAPELEGVRPRRVAIMIRRND